jgi:hypothetical protein
MDVLSTPKLAFFVLLVMQTKTSELFLLATHHGKKAQEIWTSCRPFGFGGDHNPHIDRLEVWATSILHKGPDFCEARIFSPNGRLLGTARTEGY